MQTKLFADSWEMLLSVHETRALLENIAASLVAYRAAGVFEIVFGAGLRINLQGVQVQRYAHAGRVYWTAYDAVGGWGSCPCDDWRSDHDCIHVAALQDRADEPAGLLADLLQFPKNTKAPVTAPTVTEAPISNPKATESAVNASDSTGLPSEKEGHHGEPSPVLS